MTYERWKQIERLQWEKALRDNPTANRRRLQKKLRNSMVLTHGPCPPKPRTGPPWYLKLGARAFGGGGGVGFLKKVWNWLSGKKTLISSILIGVPVIWETLEGILRTGGVEEATLVTIAGVIGLIVGWGHKILKVLGVAARPE